MSTVATGSAIDIDKMITGSLASLFDVGAKRFAQQMSDATGANTANLAQLNAGQQIDNRLIGLGFTSNFLSVEDTVPGRVADLNTASAAPEPRPWAVPQTTTGQKPS